jgi:hypothetical protein
MIRNTIRLQKQIFSAEPKFLRIADDRTEYMYMRLDELDIAYVNHMKSLREALADAAQTQTVHHA